MMPIEVIIIPLFYEMKSFNLTDSLIPLMLIPIFCSQGAISAFMFRQFFVTVPKELEEAARLDGLNHFGIFRYVMFPISMPVASSAGILAFLATWNTYLEPLVFTTSITKYTPAALSEQFQRRIRSAGMAPPAGGNHAERRSRHGRLPDFPGKGDRCDGQFRHEGINDEHSFS